MLLLPALVVSGDSAGDRIRLSLSRFVPGRGCGTITEVTVVNELSEDMSESCAFVTDEEYKKYMDRKAGERRGKDKEEEGTLLERKRQRTQTLNNKILLVVK